MKPSVGHKQKKPPPVSRSRIKAYKGNQSRSVTPDTRGSHTNSNMPNNNYANDINHSSYYQYMQNVQHPWPPGYSQTPYMPTNYNRNEEYAQCANPEPNAMYSRRNDVGPPPPPPPPHDYNNRWVATNDYNRIAPYYNTAHSHRMQYRPHRRNQLHLDDIYRPNFEEYETELYNDLDTSYNKYPNKKFDRRYSYVKPINSNGRSPVKQDKKENGGETSKANENVKQTECKKTEKPNTEHVEDINKIEINDKIGEGIDLKKLSRDIQKVIGKINDNREKEEEKQSETSSDLDSDLDRLLPSLGSQEWQVDENKSYLNSFTLNETPQNKVEDQNEKFIESSSECRKTELSTNKAVKENGQIVITLKKNNVITKEEKAHKKTPDKCDIKKPNENTYVNKKLKEDRKVVKEKLKDPRKEKDRKERKRSPDRPVLLPTAATPTRRLCDFKEKEPEAVPDLSLHFTHKKPAKITRHRRSSYSNDDCIVKLPEPESPLACVEKFYNGWMSNTRILDKGHVKKPPNKNLTNKRNMPDLDDSSASVKKLKTTDDKEKDAKMEQLKKLVLVQKCATELCLSDTKYRTARSIQTVLKTRLAKVINEDSECVEKAILVPFVGEIKNDQETVIGKPPIPEVKIECIELSDDEDEVPVAVVKEEKTEKKDEDNKSNENAETMTLYRSEDAVNNQEEVQQMSETVRVNKETLVPEVTLPLVQASATLDVYNRPTIQIHENILLNQSQTIVEVPTANETNQRTENRQKTVETPAVNENLNAGNVEKETITEVPAPVVNMNLNVAQNPRTTVITNTRKTVTAPTVTVPTNINLSNQIVVAPPPPVQMQRKKNPPPPYYINDLCQKISVILSCSVCCMLDITHMSKLAMDHCGGIKYSDSFKKRQMQSFRDYTSLQFKAVCEEFMENLLRATHNLLYNSCYFKMIMQNVEVFVAKQFPTFKVDNVLIYTACQSLFNSYKWKVTNPFVLSFNQQINLCLHNISQIRSANVLMNYQQRQVLQQQIMMYNILNQRLEKLLIETQNKKEQLMSLCLEQLLQTAPIAPPVEMPMPRENFRIRLPLSEPWNKDSESVAAGTSSSAVGENDEEDDDFVWLDTLNENELEKEIKLIPIMEPATEVKEEAPESMDLSVMLKREPSEDQCVILETFQAPSPADSGVESPPLHVDQVELLYKDRKCLCGKPALYLCNCTYAVYCSDVCQFENWSVHKKVCVMGGGAGGTAGANSIKKNIE